MHPELVVVRRDVSAPNMACKRRLLHAEERGSERRDALLLEDLACRQPGPCRDDLEAETLDVEAGIDLLRHGDDSWRAVRDSILCNPLLSSQLGAPRKLTLSCGDDLVGVVGVLGVDLQKEVVADVSREPKQELDNLDMVVVLVPYAA